MCWGNFTFRTEVFGQWAGSNEYKDDIYIGEIVEVLILYWLVLHFKIIFKKNPILSQRKKKKFHE